ncbi:hypothetical protein [Pseudofrankia sp. BMG5.37]|uniref:hypothetical protein n=1 Tax=Pseudofrankia sp. BMG5.37 TaxID=3050035 RepID=UPI002895B747|nr:hypothetical protein [Pseudofrankia sp. BMG5.37]MDT3443888.1 hypothetical protein [Pseudofrankia sp. BMG5.37]
MPAEVHRVELVVDALAGDTYPRECLGDRRAIHRHQLAFAKRDGSKDEGAAAPDGGALAADTAEELRFDIGERTSAGPAAQQTIEATRKRQNPSDAADPPPATSSTSRSVTGTRPMPCRNGTTTALTTSRATSDSAAAGPTIASSEYPTTVIFPQFPSNTPRAWPTPHSDRRTYRDVPAGPTTSDIVELFTRSVLPRVQALH